MPRGISINDRTRRRLCIGGAFGIIALFSLAWILGRVLVRAMYERRAPEFLNNVIASAADRSLDHYLERFDSLLLIAGLTLVVPIAVFLLLAGLLSDDARSSFRKQVRVLVGYLRTRWQQVYFLSAVAVVLFGLGMYAGSNQKFPYALLVDAKRAATELFETADLINQHPHKISAEQPRDGVTILDADEVQPGLNFITLFRREKFEIILMDNEGEVIHTWSVPANVTLPERNKDLLWTLPDNLQPIHGAHLYDNGDVVFNFENKGLVRIDHCSNVVWALNESTHHAVAVDADGTIWVPARQLIRREEKAAPRMRVPYWDDMLLHLRPNGEIISRTSLIRSIIESHYQGILFGGDQDYPESLLDDPLHLNDVDIVDSALASRLSEVSEGDIMVSLRTINAVMILDRKDKSILWSFRGPFLRQHDPEILPDGTLLVYDNRTDIGQHNGAVYLTEPQTFGYSRILRLDPTSQAIIWSYEGSVTEPFYSSIMGKHQPLPNGNVLVVETEGGRVFELDPEDNQIVWEFVNNLDESTNFVGRISQAERVSAEQMTFLNTPCL